MAKQEVVDLFGKEMQVGMSVFEATCRKPELRAQAVDIWKRALLGETLTVVEEFKPPGNQLRLYEKTYYPNKNADGKTIGAQCLVRRIPHEILSHK